MILLLIILQFQNTLAPAELAEKAAQYFMNAQYAAAIEAWSELCSRMPTRGRIAYNLASSQFMMDSLTYADSILSTEITDIREDTLSAARILTSLALSIQENDYSGVESSVYTIRGIAAEGHSMQCERTALEAGLNWLDNHEPPEDQQDQNDDQQDQSDDQQDQSDDQQDQSDDQQDQSDDQQDQSDDQQDQSDDQQNDRQYPSRVNEMTPEQAQAILDLVEDMQPEDSTGTRKTGYPTGPIW